MASGALRVGGSGAATNDAVATVRNRRGGHVDEPAHAGSLSGNDEVLGGLHVDRGELGEVPDDVDLGCEVDDRILAGDGVHQDRWIGDGALDACIGVVER